MNDLVWARGIAGQIKEKERKVAERNRGKIPYTTRDGRFNDMSVEDIHWWTNGFWGGMMWQLYRGTGETLFRESAEKNEHQLDAVLMAAHGLDHDNGFRWLPTSVAHYRINGCDKSWNRALLAANNLAGRFNPVGNFIRAWNDKGDGSTAGWAIIDCMMNLPLLYWASAETKDPRFRHIAVSHANTVIGHFIREDGSVRHIVEFNPETGEYIKNYGGQGVREGSSWTRGQAWALYGFILSYLHTSDKKYLDTAVKIADYFIAHIPNNGLIPVDFCQSEDCSLEDSTAGAIAACGLLEISKAVHSDEINPYYQSAVFLLKTLSEKRCNWNPGNDNLLEKCTAAFNDKEHEFPIIYGDYFYIEAIWKLTGEELFIW